MSKRLWFHHFTWDSWCSTRHLFIYCTTSILYCSVFCTEQSRHLFIFCTTSTLYCSVFCTEKGKVEIMIYLWNPQLVVLVRQAKVCHGCLESTWFPSLLLKQTIHITICRSLKGTVLRDFRPLVFFHNSNQLGPLTNGLKYFRILFSFCRDTESAQYHTAPSQKKI